MVRWQRYMLRDRHMWRQNKVKVIRTISLQKKAQGYDQQAQPNNYAPNREMTKIEPVETLADGSEPTEKQLLQFFLDNPNPSDKEVHAFAEKLGMDEHKLEEVIYRLVTKYAQIVNKETK